MRDRDFPLPRRVKDLGVPTGSVVVCGTAYLVCERFNNATFDALSTRRCLFMKWGRPYRRSPLACARDIHVVRQVRPAQLVGMDIGLIARRPSIVLFEES